MGNDIRLLGALAHALSDKHTVPAAGRALITSTRTHWPIIALEIGRRDPVRERGYHATLFVPDGDTVSTSQHARSLEELTLLEQASPIQTYYSQQYREADIFELSSVPRELRRLFLHRRGIENLLVLPLTDENERVGYAVLALGTLDVPRPSVLIDAVANLLRGAFRHIQLVERVASLSRRAHVETQHLRNELQRKSDPDRLAAVSDSSRRLLELVDLVASTDTCVLLRGESGTGKEVIARRIHRLSVRANRPFLKVNCGALPESLIESALFGHERGAFTDASMLHRGLFERAHGGTLLLDEVAELPLRAQAKLLRVLQEGELERIGGENTYRVDVRLLVATHQPLEALIERGAFRADLYYRLNVFPILLAPLRDRLADLPLLTEVLLERVASRHGRLPPRLTPALIAGLLRHSWPGNVRELENLLERALILTPEGEPLALPPDAREPPPLPPTHWVPPQKPQIGAPAPVTLDAAIRQVIEQALLACNGQIYGPSGAAKRLGMKPSTLQSKLSRLGISRTQFVAPPTPGS